MLPDEIIGLLTAFVDGELRAHQRKAVLRVLHRSAEARELLLVLQENARKIQQLPRRALPARFASDVTQIIADRRLQPDRSHRRPVSRRGRWLRYAAVGTAVAAVFLLMLGGALWLAVENPGAIDELVNPGNGVVKGGPVDPPARAENTPTKADAPSPSHRADPLIARLVDGAYQSFAAPIPPTRTVSVPFNELRTDGHAGSEFLSELKRNEALQLDVTVQSNRQAIERLSAVLQKYGVKLVIDPESKNALSSGRDKADFLVYAENMQAEEVAKLLTQLAAADKKTGSPFRNATMSALSNRNQQQVASLLGTDPTKRDQGTTTGMIGKVPTDPPNKVERVAVILPQSTSSKASEEVRQFLYQRARPQPGSVRVLLRIHQE